MKTTTAIDSTGKTFTMAKGSWSSTFPISDLGKWLEFYRRQRERHPDHAASYYSDVEALEALARQIEASERS